MSEESGFVGIRAFNYAMTLAEMITLTTEGLDNGLFVAVASSGTNRVMESSDGVNWIPRSTPVGSWNSVSFGGGMFVSVGPSEESPVMNLGTPKGSWFINTTTNNIRVFNGQNWETGKVSLTGVLSVNGKQGWLSGFTNNIAEQVLLNKTLTTPSLSSSASGTVSGRLGYTSGAGLTFGHNSQQRVVLDTDSPQSLTNKTFPVSTFTGVQSTLVAGDNIKRVESNSLLGEGDLEILLGAEELLGVYNCAGASIIDVEDFSPEYDTYRIDGVGISGGSSGTGAFRTRMKFGGSYLTSGYSSRAPIRRTGDGSGVERTFPLNYTVTNSAASQDWNSVAYGEPSGVGIFVAVGSSGGNRVATSPDGETWTLGVVDENEWNSIIYANGLFVAVAGTGTDRVMTSPDGITWTARNAPSSNWQSVTYGNGLFVAVASSGTNRVMTSPDAITWTARTASEQNSWQAIAYGEPTGGGLFVAVASSGTNRVMTSPDGITWTARAVTISSWCSVVFDNGLFVVGARAGEGTVSLMTSANGTLWTNRVSNIYRFESITYRAPYFVAGGAQGISTSSNGTSWSSRATPSVNVWKGVTHSPSRWVAVGEPTSDNNTSMTSTVTTGTSGWVDNGIVDVEEWRDVVYGETAEGGLLVAVASSGTNRVMTSPDGITWTARNAVTGTWQSVAFGNGLFVAVAINGVNQVMTSPDGVTWTLRTAITGTWRSVTFGNGLFVVVGTDQVMTSPDGVTWTLRTTLESRWGYVVYNNNLFVVTTTFGGADVITSPDGVNWTLRDVPQDSSRGVAYGNGLFVSVGYVNDNRVMTSPDGINWTGHNFSTGFPTGISYGGGVFLMSVDNPTANYTSSDGVTWQLRDEGSLATVPALPAAYVNGVFVNPTNGELGARIISNRVLNSYIPTLPLAEAGAFNVTENLTANSPMPVSFSMDVVDVNSNRQKCLFTKGMGATGTVVSPNLSKTEVRATCIHSDSSAPLQGIRFYVTSGQINQGFIYLYGVRKNV